MTLDGKIATRTGQSKWITGEQARARVHQDRHRYSGIMVGVGTILADDPLLTCRMEGGKNPTRILCDSHLRTPLNAQVIRTAREVPIILATLSQDPAAARPFQAAGCQVWTLPQREGHVDLVALMERLGAEQIDSVLLEGGSTLNWAALHSGVVQKVQAYIAPKLFGGTTAKSPIGGLGVQDPQQAFLLRSPTLTQLGEDFLWEGEITSHVHRDH